MKTSLRLENIEGEGERFDSPIQYIMFWCWLIYKMIAFCSDCEYCSWCSQTQLQYRREKNSAFLLWAQSTKHCTTSNFLFSFFFPHSKNIADQVTVWKSSSELSGLRVSKYSTTLITTSHPMKLVMHIQNVLSVVVLILLSWTSHYPFILGSTRAEIGDGKPLLLRLETTISSA